MSRPDWRPSDYLCPDCARRLESTTGPGGINCQKCPNCEWAASYDPDADEHPSDELERARLATDGGRATPQKSGQKVSAFPYIGSKTFLAPWIVDHLAAHETFVVPFGGAAGVLLNKPRSRAEIFNDRDEYVVEFFEVVRDYNRSAALDNETRRERLFLSYDPVNTQMFGPAEQSTLTEVTDVAE